ncbi:polar amino acid ABC transporter inner membrane subunit [Caballeronia glebae]|uniref:Polar amino acid ABC transporter inner membrane subunit n=1 Tax=Caballeronia glebae TaxID=1777143 RepID=A0A158B044_9BURK|nr:amino acid ABC transporter permease [Caballeronia glebae]SAK63353.1 polar amino acid ABC transporter inner membrane subunit [Caballeronia glebae]
MIDIIRDNWLVFLIGQYPNGPLGGLALTLILSVLGLGLSFPISIGLALCRTGSIRWLANIATVFVYIIRGIPLVMLVFWTYFLVPVLVGHTVSGVTTLLCTLVIYEAAYLSEVIRAGLMSLPKGQLEAARALGLGYWRTTCFVLLPQALYNMVPSIISQLVSTIKETSIGYVISVQELTFAANAVNNNLLTRPFAVFMILALTYFVACFTLTQVAHYFERRVTRRRTRVNVAIRSLENDTVLESQ